MLKRSANNSTTFDWADLAARQLPPWTEEDLRREVAAARQTEVDIRGSEDGLPSLDEMMKRYKIRDKS